MADAITEGTAKLLLDDETGEMVSKNELAKRTKKRAKKAATAKAKESAPPKDAAAAKPKPKEKVDEPTLDPEAMFKQGFLADVYQERPEKSVLTRFPPEPNGFLHIGHAKAIAVNFGFAKYHGGNCYLRYDDTNPEAEEEKYFVAIEEMVRWLGFSPYKITYSSDNFDKLYALAERLIELERAYVCHCNDEEIKAQRGGENHGPRFRCAHADKTVETNLEDFRGMRDGKYKPREAFLRMKMDIADGNPQMWDLAAYRVLEKPHHRSGDSTVLSKRKIHRLVAEGIVRGWDDPRLYTLIGIKRRGVPPGAILEFVNELGVTTAPSVVELKRFDQTVRRYLERTVPRLMLVLDPIPVIVEDAEEMEVDVPFNPKIPAMGSHKVKYTPTVYIDRSDFREVDSKDYFRLAPNKTVGLLQAPHPIKAVSFSKDEATGKVTEIRAVYDKETKKPKTFIQWAASGSRKVEVRLHNSLFKSEKPDSAEGGFLNDLNPESEVVYPDALIESGFDEVKRRAPWPEAAGESELGKGGPESVRFQGMRVAYFAVDSDSTDDKIVLNKIVSLKEDAGKS
ncbi:glutaminyl-tRNA synthetase [Seiridium cupressi]